MIIRATNQNKLVVGSHSFSCLFGKNGIATHKQEGDLKTPRGVFCLIKVLWRKDRLLRPQTCLPTTAIAPHLGWCDDPKSPLYNRAIDTRYQGNWRHEKMWRADNRYDLVVVVGYNYLPAIKHKGSAIFIHPSKGATAGCVGMPLCHLIKLLRLASPHTKIAIG